MRGSYLALIALVAFPACAVTDPPSAAENMGTRVSVLLGRRTLDDSEVWDPVSKEFTAGVELSRAGESGFGFEGGLLGSTGFENRFSENVDVTAAILEAFVGLRKEFDLGGWHPYIGAGGAIVGAAIDNDSGGAAPDDEDITAAYYGRAGVLYDLEERVYFGIDVRFLGGSELEYETVTTDVDYRQITFVLGTRF